MHKSFLTPFILILKEVPFALLEPRLNTGIRDVKKEMESEIEMLKKINGHTASHLDHEFIFHSSHIMHSFSELGIFFKAEDTLV